MPVCCGCGVSGERGGMGSNSSSSRIAGGGGDVGAKDFYFSNQDDREREARHRAVQQQNQGQGRGPGAGTARRSAENGSVEWAAGTAAGGGGGAEESVRVNPWRQMKLHELMAKLEDSSVS